jgi:predicted metal-dependent phosphoesterase TrpH
MYNGLIHFHSNNSYDSILKIKSIVNFALKNKLNFLALTDHDTISGSEKLKDYIDKNNINIEIIIGAEYLTEYGDIVVLNIDTEIQNRTFTEFINEVKLKKGVLFLPHPYVGHKNIELLAQSVDFIEVFNSRVTEENNDRAFQLAKKYSKPFYYASDAHTKKDLKNAIMKFEKRGDLVASLNRANITYKKLFKTTNFEVIFSQFVKAIKNKNIILFINLCKSFIVLLLKGKLFKPI